MSLSVRLANRAAPQNKISSIIRKAREEAGVPCDVESGQRLHDALCAIQQRSCDYQTLMRHRKGRLYRAPETLRGSSITLMDGWVLDTRRTGPVCWRAPARAVETLSVHRQLRDAGFGTDRLATAHYYRGSAGFDNP